MRTEPSDDVARKEGTAPEGLKTFNHLGAQRDSALALWLSSLSMTAVDDQGVRLTPASRTPDRREGSAAALRRRLSGDLDVIVLKALSKEPQRRYASVEQFAEDIRRHLEGLPVTARRDSWSYRAGRFAIRHKLAVTATGLVLLAVLGGVAATVREARIAAANERRAEQRFNDVRKLANSLMFEIHDAIRDLPGSTPARRLLVTRALEYLDNLSVQSKGDASLQKELASAYERVGDVLGYPYGANLGDKAGALQSYRKALAIRESLATAAPDDTDLQREIINNSFSLAQVLEAGGNFAEALAVVRKATPFAQRLASGSSDPKVADLFAGSYYATASIQVQTGDYAAALENYKQSASIRAAASQANPGIVALRSRLAADYAGIAKCLEAEHDLPQAIETQAKAVAILDELSTANPQSAMLSEFLGEATNRIGTYRIEHGEPAAALEAYRGAHQIFGRLFAADPKNYLAKSNFGFSDNGIGQSLMALGKPASAMAVFQESKASFEEMSPRTASDRYLRSGLADAYSGLGGTYASLARAKNTSRGLRRQYWDESRSSCEKSLTLWKDKEKRGEVESGERESAAQVGKCVAESEAELAKLGSGEAH